MGLFHNGQLERVGVNPYLAAAPKYKAGFDVTGVFRYIAGQGKWRPIQRAPDAVVLHHAVFCQEFGVSLH